DKPAKSAVLETASDPPEQAKNKSKTSRKGAKTSTKKTSAKADGSETGQFNTGPYVGNIKVSNPNRVVFHEPNISKREVVKYYEAAAEQIYPHLQKRHVALLRCPDGTQSTCIFQKHIPGLLPEGVSRDAGDVILTDALGAV